jgi:ATP/maltotriose-dependent transcriptional regulator MalT
LLSRVLAALGVGVWCLFVFLTAVAFIIDRGLADVGIVWIAFLGIGVVAPVLLLRQINHSIATHEESRRAVPGAREKEKELLRALEEREPSLKASPSASGSPDDTPKPLAEPLSERELEVLTLLASGRPNREIARDLFVAVGTVKTHTNNIYRKLSARNRAEAVARARSLKLI